MLILNGEFQKMIMLVFWFLCDGQGDDTGAALLLTIGFVHQCSK